MIGTSPTWCLDGEQMIRQGEKLKQLGYVMRAVGIRGFFKLS